MTEPTADRLVLKLYDSHTLHSSEPMEVPPDHDERASKEALQGIEAAVRNVGGTVSIDGKSRQLGGIGYDGLTGFDLASTVVATLSALGGGAVVLRTVRDLLLQWLKNRSTRYIRVSVNDRTIEIHGDNDIDRVLEAIRDLEEKT